MEARSPLPPGEPTALALLLGMFLAFVVWAFAHTEACSLACMPSESKATIAGSCWCVGADGAAMKGGE